MDQIGVVGLSYRHAGADQIAGFTLPKDEIAARLAALREAIGTAEVLYLATCNRVEVAFAMPDGEGARDIRSEIFRAITGRTPGPNEARSALRAWTGEAAVEHLFLIACGLDSAQAGEREIAAQLRLAWEAAREAGVCGPLLNRIVGEALSLSGRLQRLAAEARPPSLADLASERMLLHLREDGAVSDERGAISVERPSVGPEQSRFATPAPIERLGSAVTRRLAATHTADTGVGAKSVALVGVSPMTRRCGERLHQAGVSVVVVNRTADTGEEFARIIGATAMPLSEFRARPSKVDGLIVATGGNEPVLDVHALRKLASTAPCAPLIIDFGLPPNIDPQAARDAGLPRIGMNEMIQASQDRRLAQLLRLAPMRAAIDERLARLRGQLATRAIGRQLAGLRSEFERIAAAETERALGEELQSLSPEQQDQVRRVANTIAHRLAHLPLAGIRAVAEHATPETVDAFFREARLHREGRLQRDPPLTHEVPLPREAPFAREAPPQRASRPTPAHTSAGAENSSREPSASDAPRAATPSAPAESLDR
jgi:glutamyl-tRNA reductase